MQVKFKWITFLLCICAASYIGINHFSTYFVSSKQQHSTKSYKSCIIESCSIADVLDYVDNQRTVVVFDLDNTLVHPGKDLGSDQWFSYLFKEKLATGSTVQAALEEILPLYYEVHDHILLCPVEPESPSTVSTLQKNGVITVALTSRSLPLVKRTQEQLRDAGFSFAHAKQFDS